MMSPLFVLIFCFGLLEAKLYDRCELARELKHVHNFPVEEIPIWVCIAQHESQYNTSAVNRASGDHGLFQISDLFWCSPPGKGFACNAACAAFEDDDIADDVICVRRIFREHSRLSGSGFNAWTVYPLYCKSEVGKYVEGCFDNEVDGAVTSTRKPGDDEDDDVYEFPPLPTPPKKKLESSSVKKVPLIKDPGTTPLMVYTKQDFSEKFGKLMSETPLVRYMGTTPLTKLNIKSQELSLKTGKPILSEYSFAWKKNGFKLTRNS